jgi:RHS repeat-associated protein
MNLWKIVLFSMLIALALALVPAPAHAQSGSAYGWYPGYQAGGANCWASPSGSGALCATAADACWSIASFQDGGAPGYAFLFPTYVPYLGTTGIWNSGLSCAWPYLTDRFVGGVNLLLPPGTSGDSNSPTGNSPPGPGGPQVIKLIGGSDSDPGNPDDNSQTNPPIPADPNTDPSSTGDNSAGDPINVPSGNLAYYKTDYKTAGPNPLSFTRYYNSRGTFVGSLGFNWRSSYDRYLYLFSSTSVEAQRADGQLLLFTLTAGVWTHDSDVDYTLTNSGTTWTLTDPDDTVETYVTTTGGYAPGSFAQLNTIVARNGYTKTLTYNSYGQLITVTDSYSRTLTYAYENGGMLNTVTTPDSTVITFAFSSSYSSPAGVPNLTSVTYPTSPTQALTYVYANTSLPHTLTGVIDESGNTFLTWTYDAYGRALTSTVGNGSATSTTSVSYNDTTGSRTVTNPLGVVSTYSYSTLQNAQKVTGISRAATATTAAASRSFTYDTNGYLASETDWNGNQTTYVNNSHGKPTTINEAVGSSVARTTTIAYDPTFVHLPDSITTPGLTTSYTYDGVGEPLTKKLADTTSQSVPYSTNGQTRTWTYTWSNSLPATVKTPNGNTTTFTYTSGTLTKISNALTQATNITASTGGGYPETIVDPNGVTTTDAYDARQRLTSSAVSTSAGTLTTSWTYYTNSEVTKTLPDGSLILSLVDTGHRIIGYADNYDNQIGWTLDALGDPGSPTKFNPGGTITFERGTTFDALGRLLKDTSLVTTKSWVYTYDNNGNRLTVTDPLNHTTTQVFDALNRLSTSTDANSGVATYTYDAHNRPLTIKDKDGYTTSYVYDGFGDTIQQASPDSGTTVYHFDSDGNRTSRTDAASVVTNYTYDALDRVATTAYPADSTENVTYTYDQTGHGFGIGRLTSLTDAAGSLSRTYDERGNRLTDKRTNGSNILTTTYTYDKASRVASITYPSGAVSSYTRDNAGNVTQMPFSATHSDEAYSLWSVTHLPFGPANFINYNNGDYTNFTFDLDYRQTVLEYETYAAVPYFKWTYGYDAADNPTTITDGITSANSQTLGYDVLNRLNSASSSGTYGTLAWNYDKNGNLTSSTAGGTTYTYGLATGTNRLSTITWPSNSESAAYTATGNVSTLTLNSTNVFTGTYNKNNRLASVTGVPLAISSETYDAFGKRITKANPGSNPNLYTYDLDGNLIEENDGGVITDYIYMDGINVANWEPGEQHLYAINFDRRGVPMVSRDEYGLTNWAAYSTPYGGMTVTQTTGTYTGPPTQNLRLPGQYFDHEDNLHNNGFRDYSWGWGRYIEADPIGLRGGLNPYLYASGNPMRFTDRTGRSSSSTQQQADDSPAQNGLPYIPPYPTMPDDQAAQDNSSDQSILSRAYGVGQNFIEDPLTPGQSPLSIGEQMFTAGGGTVLGALFYNDAMPGGPQQADTLFNQGVTGGVLSWWYDVTPPLQTAPPPITQEEFDRTYPLPQPQP